MSSSSIEKTNRSFCSNLSFIQGLTNLSVAVMNNLFFTGTAVLFNALLKSPLSFEPAVLCASSKTAKSNAKSEYREIASMMLSMD
ncbi:hypothetical protein D1872_319380 [compost metagenome]